MWRLLAGVMVALGLVLPLSTCTRGEPPVTEYHYALGDVIQNEGCTGACRAGAVALTLVTLLWPLAAWLAARRFTGRKGLVARLCAEPLLVAGSGWWLYWQVFLREPASGFIVASLGLAVYAVIWLVELISSIRAYRARPRVAGT